MICRRKNGWKPNPGIRGLTISELEAREHELRLQTAQGALKLEHLREKTREQFGCELESILERPQPSEEDFEALARKRRGTEGKN